MIPKNQQRVIKIQAELIAWLALYNKILSEEIAELVPYATAKGWVSSKHNAGLKCREKISELVQELKIK